MKKFVLTIMLFGILFCGYLLFYDPLNSSREYKADLAYSDFIKRVRAGKIERVEISNRVIKLRTSAGEEFETYNPDR